MTTRRPAEVFPPGEFLKEELDARGWSQADFAEIMGRPPATVSDLILGKRSISPEIARGLAAALGTSAEFWMNLDTAYQLSRVRRNEDDVITRRAKLYEKAPIKEMVRRGWIEHSDNVEVLEKRVLTFLRINSLDEEPDVPLHAARKATSYGDITPGQLVWLLRAHQLARAVSAKPFSERGVDEAIERLRSLMHAIQEIRHVPRILSEAGIKFVIVQPLPGSRIDGACFWADESPVIAMTLRFDRIDNFWFVLMHEIGHIKNRAESLDSDLESQAGDTDRPVEEREADAFALETLVPQYRIEGFIARIRPLYSARRIEAFAHTLGLHPAIVIGQLQHRGEIAYSSFRKSMEPVREWITPAALTDGWGSALRAQL